MSAVPFVGFRRDVFDDPFFRLTGEPFCRRAAWGWMLMRAGAVNVTPRGQLLQPGQIATSLGEMAKEWGWQRPKVQRFLVALYRRYKVECIAEGDGRVITIPNYRDFCIPDCIADTGLGVSAIQLDVSEIINRTTAWLSARAALPEKRARTWVVAKLRTWSHGTCYDVFQMMFRSGVADPIAYAESRFKEMNGHGSRKPSAGEERARAGDEAVRAAVAAAQSRARH